ncbi:TfoX/Sxy family protein [Paracoccus albus]|uniref:TfoX/Sxy family protein n=1 Tax=Paracoccus albus TaxID=3017784 RepID=UPI0022F0499A|nr:TfoX/Sxy family protein [Paracoccus albus]WBU60058.1 TfoX/Sxy family protein [Paracoccus albus]
MAYDKALAERARNVLAALGGAEEISMMGGLCFLRGGNMACGVNGDRLMVRLGAEGAAAAMNDPDVGPLNIGGGRSPKAFVTVSPAGTADDAALEMWISRGVSFADSLPAKKR